MRRWLRRQGGGTADVEIHSLAALGTGPFDYCFLADEIAAVDPDRVVVALSLNAFGDTFRSLSRRRISGWVAPHRLPRVSLLPIHWIGLTLDDLLLNVAIVRSGGFEPWRWLLAEQVRLDRARDALRRGLSERIGRNGVQGFEVARFATQRARTHVPGRERYRAASERRHYGALLGRFERDHPVLVSLRESLETLVGFVDGNSKVRILDIRMHQYVVRAVEE